MELSEILKLIAEQQNTDIQKFQEKVLKSDHLFIFFRLVDPASLPLHTVSGTTTEVSVRVPRST